MGNKQDDAALGGVPSAADTVDLRQAFQAMTADLHWVRKTAVVGAVALFVPLLGYVVMLGWMRDVFERARAGESSLPTLSFRQHLGQGWAPTAALFSSFALFLVLFVGSELLRFPVDWGLRALYNSTSQGSLAQGAASALTRVVHVLLMPLSILSTLAMPLFVVSFPEVLRRGLRGESVPALTPMVSVRAVKDHLGTLLLVVVGGLAFNVVAQVGFLALFVGALVTMPLALVGHAHLLAQWDSLVDPQD